MSFDQSVALHLQDISDSERDLTPSEDTSRNWSTANIERTCGLAVGSVTNLQSDYVSGRTRSAYTSFSASFSYSGQTYTMNVTGAGVASISVSSGDTAAPTLASSIPTDNATAVAVGSNIVLTFSENIQAGTGDIVISDGAGDTRTIPVGDAQITIAGTTLTINPTADLNSSTSYYLQIDATAVDDLAGNSYAGITDTTTLNFTTADTTAPTLASSTPADGATGVAVNSNIVLTFSEAVDTETGNIVIKKVSDNSTVENFDVATSTEISGSGTTTITINPTSDLAGSTDYYIEIDATAFDDAAGNSYAGISGATTLNFTTAAPPNTAPISDAGPDQTVGSGAVVSLDGSGSSDGDGDPLTYAWTQLSGTTVTLSNATAAQPTFTAPTLEIGDADGVLVFSLTVNDGTVNSAVDSVTITVEAPSPTPATAFVEYEEEIRATLVDDARRNLTSAMAANQRLIRDARGRFIVRGQAADQDSGVVSQNDIPFDVDGTFALNGTTLSTRGSFFEQTANYEGTQRRLFFGDFDVQHDGDTGSTTATLTARVAWEQMTSDRTMLGYFIGGELVSSNIAGAFEGDQDRVGVTAGGYAVHQLAEEVYFDGFLSYGVGRNNLDMANDVLALTSDYTTRTATAGVALSGIYEYKQYEFRPELAFSYGHTWIGSVGFTGRAYGLVDDTLSLDAGTVSIANLTLRPEVIWALDADTVADSNSQLSFAPRAICERSIATTRTENCGGGAELGLSSTSEDGLSTADFRIIMDRVGSSNRSSFAFNLEHRF